MKKIFFSISMVLSLAWLYSCSSGGTAAEELGGLHQENLADTVPPVVTINTPVPNQVFSSGSSISMTGNISDDLGLYRGTVKLVNDANGAVLKEQYYEIHGIRSYDYSVAYTPTVTSPADYTVIVTFEDHGYNNVSRTVKIKVNP